jgi:hypothetical protein
VIVHGAHAGGQLPTREFPTQNSAADPM